MRLSHSAQYRWPGLLIQLGVPENYLTGRHGPCPMCEGKDRYRFDDKDGTGTYFCNQCGAGDGFTLLMRFHNWDFKQTAQEIEKIMGDVAEMKPVQKKDPRIGLRRIQDASKPISEGDEVVRYLRNRRLSVYPETLQIARLPYYENGKNIGEYDCMVAKVVSVVNQPLTYHITYLQDGAKADVPSPRKVKTPVESIKGGAIRLFPIAPHIVICEGIETAIAVHEITGLPCWSVLSAGGIESFQVPNGVHKVSIYGDADDNSVGQAAAYALAKRLAGTVDVLVSLPTLLGQDWLDVLMEERG